jgi:hypothetical protein
MDLSMPGDEWGRVPQAALTRPDLASIPFIAYSAVFDVRNSAQELDACGVSRKADRVSARAHIIRTLQPLIG